jgi:hypothetical protein
VLLTTWSLHRRSIFSLARSSLRLPSSAEAADRVRICLSC